MNLTKESKKELESILKKENLTKRELDDKLDAWAKKLGGSTLVRISRNHILYIMADNKKF